MTDPSRSPPSNVALLIDADNASPDRLGGVLTVLAELGRVGVRRAYGNWSKPALKGWERATLANAIEPQQQFDVTKGKSATDMRMIIDAMDLMHSGRVDGFGIMSSDSDFGPLAMRIQQEGLTVYGFGEDKTPVSFQRACTRFFDVAALAAPEPDVGAAPVPAQPTREVDGDVIELIGRAIKAAKKRDERHFAPLSEIKNLAGNQSSFDARNYGFNNLAELVRKLDMFRTEERGGTLWVKRVR